MSENKTIKKLPLRSEVQLEDTWNLEAIYPTDEAWNEAFQKTKDSFSQIESLQGTLKNGPKELLHLLNRSHEIGVDVGKLYAYAHMRYDQDTTNSLYQGYNDRVKGLAAAFSSAIAFIQPEILELDEKTVESFLESDKELKVYDHFLKAILLKRPHVLSADQEALLAQAGEVLDASSGIFSALNNADLEFPTIKDEKGEEVQVTHGRYVNFLQSEDRRVREDAFNAVYDTYGKLQNTFASTLSSTMKAHLFNANARKYDSARHAALSQNNIPEKVYDQLVDTVHKNLHLLHRYVKLRKKVLGVEKLHTYDLYAPLVKEVDMKIPYSQAKDILMKALKPMGEEYLSILNEGLSNRWVDVYENKGKRSGAYSSGSYGTPPYILMNWQDNLNNLFTLAHEFGHSLHSYYTRKCQPIVYGDYSIFVAEVASTCNEALLNDYLLKTIEDPKERLYILNHYLEGFRGTVFRQTMFAEFEHMIHQKAAEGVALTAERMTQMYYDLNKLYFGEEDIIIDEKIGLEWARIPHFYYDYYVFQYATGFSAATALSQQILNEGEKAVERYIGYLKSGSSDYPIEVLKSAGVDMTTAAPIESACRVFEEQLTEMEKLLG